MRKMTHQATDSSVLITVDEAMQRYQVGRAAMMKLGKDSEAIVRIGRSLRFSVGKIDKYVEKLCKA